jgi:hypothetical protein
MLATILLQPTDKPKKQTTTAKKPDSDKETEKCETFWQRIKREPIALCTFLLVIATSILALTSFIQIILLNRAEHITETAANAAKQSAVVAEKTLIITHRPWCASYGDIETIKPVSFDSDKITFSFRQVIKNGGTAPALKVYTSMAINIGTLNQLMQYARQRPSIFVHKGSGLFILPGDIVKSIQEVSHPIDISQFQNTNIFVLLTLYTTYRDEFDTLHSTDERWQYVSDENEGPTSLPKPSRDIGYGSE